MKHFKTYPSMQKRSISESFLNSLKAGLFKSVVDIVRIDPSLDLEMRGDTVKVYYRGGKILTIHDPDLYPNMKEAGFLTGLDPKYSNEEKSKQAAIDRLPKNLVCPKCDGVNADPNQFCEYCGYDFLEHNFSEEAEEGIGCIGYLVAFLFPIIGLIWGIIRGDKGVIIFSIIMCLLGIISSLLLYNTFLFLLL
jgi:hypothetical protein